MNRPDEEWDSLAILNCQWRLRDDSALFVAVEDKELA